MNTTENYRYPGSRPFQDTNYDRRLFFGRDDEKQALLHLVLAENLVVLFAKSGLGKTSLINAGLLQTLRERGFLPIKVRFNDSEVSPLQSLYLSIEETVRQSSIDCTSGERESLGHYFKTVEFWSLDDNLLTPVLILDQFEEFFTMHSPGERRTFITQIADLVKGRRPQEPQRAILQEELPDSDVPPQVKIIISLREDYLGQLEEMSLELPGILQNRFRLSALHREQAEQAIIEPAQLKDDAIKTYPFRYAPETVEAMLDFLCKQRTRGEVSITDEVEPFQLQLLCQHIENIVQERPAEDAEFPVKPRNLGNEAEMQRVLQKFYDEQIDTLGSTWEKRRVQKFCETGLISASGRRLSLEEVEIERHFKIPKPLLSKLVDSRLLRAEPRVGSLYYELSHDTLVEPIQTSYRKRKRKKSQKLFSIAIIVLLAMLLVFFLWPYINERLYQTAVQLGFGTQFSNVLYQKAQKLQLEKKNEQASELYAQIIEIDKSFVDAYIALGQLYMDEGNFNKAIGIYSKAINNHIENTIIKTRLSSALYDAGKYEEALEKYRELVQLVPDDASVYKKMGDILWTQGKYDRALGQYFYYLQLVPTDAYAYARIGDALATQKRFDDALEQYDKAIELASDDSFLYAKLGDILFTQERYDEAGEIYQKAIQLLPEDAHTLARLGDVYLIQNMIHAATESYAMAFKYASDDESKADAYRGFGDLYFVQKQYSEALTNYRKVLEILSRDPTIYKKIGDVFFQLGQNAQAREAYQNALKGNPINDEIYTGLGDVSFSEGNYEDAQKEYQRAFELSVHNSQIKIKLASTCLLTKDFSKTIVLASEIIESSNPFTDPGDILTVRLLLIVAFLCTNQEEEAIDAIEGFTRYYNSNTKEYTITWQWSAIKNFIHTTSKLSKQDRIQLTGLIDILELPTKIK